MADGLHLPTAVGTLLAIDGAFHLAVGAASLLESVTLLALLLVLWGTVALLGVAVTAVGYVPKRTAYIGGLVLVTVALGGYVDVQVLGVSETLIGIEWQPLRAGHAHDTGGHAGHGHTHGSFGGQPGGIDAGVPARLWMQLASDHLGFPAKVVEVHTAGLLVYLLVWGKPAE